MAYTYYVAPHFEFDINNLDHDCHLSCFVIANSTYEAADLWCNFIEDETGVTLYLAHGPKAAPMPPDLDLKNTIQIYAVTMAADAVSPGVGYVPWTKVPMAYALVRE